MWLGCLTTLAKRVRSFFAKVDEYYPDKRVEGLHNAHKKLGERLTALYRELGYSSGEEMMRAYGYEYIQKADRRDKGTRISELIAKLKKRYPNGSGFRSVLELKNANPDLSGTISSLQIKKDVFIQEGIISGSVLPTAEDFEVKCSELLLMIQETYPDGPQWTNQMGLTDALPEARQLIADIQDIMKRILHRPFVEEMKRRGIFAERDALLAKQNSRKASKNTSISYFRRKCLMGESERSFTGITRNAFGMPFSDYKICRERTEPGGEIGAAMQAMKKLIPQLDRIADTEGQIPETSLSPHSRNLSKITDSLGYADVKALLLAYGYTIISAQNHDDTASFSAPEPENEINDEASDSIISVDSTAVISDKTMSTSDDSDEKHRLLSRLCAALQALIDKNTQSVPVDETDDEDDEAEYLYTGFEDADEEDDAASRMVNAMFAQHRQLTIRKIGDTLHFDAAFAVTLNDSWEYYPDTEEDYPALVSCVDSIAEKIWFYLKPFAAAYPGAVKEAVSNTASNADQGAAQLMLYQSDDVEIGVVVISHEDDDYDPDITQYKACLIVRIGSYSVLFDSLYGHYRYERRDTLIEDFQTIGGLFREIEILHKGERICAEITDAQIEDLADQLFGEEITEESDSIPNAAVADALEQMRTLTASAGDELQKMQNALEVQKQLLEAEEKRTDYTADLTDTEIRSLMYLALLLEYENGTKRTSEAFYDCYKDDFSSVSEQDMKLLYNEFSQDVYAGERNDLYEDLFREMPFAVKFYYAVENAFNTADIKRHKSCRDFAYLFGKQWFSSDEMEQFYDGIDRLTEENRESIDSQFAAIDDSWRRFVTARSSLVISLQDNDFTGYDPYNPFMQDCGAYIAVVKLKSGGVLSLSAVLHQNIVDYWDTDYQTIWDAALENEPYDQRYNQSKGIITAMAKLAHDKALANNDGNTKSPETTAAAENTVLSADHSQKSASETSTYDKKGYLPAKILSVISAVLFALYGIQMFAMSKIEWWNRFIVTDRALENDPSVYKPIMGMGGLMLSATALILFLYLQKHSNGSTNGKKLSVSSVITDLIGALAVNSIMFTYASSEFTVRLLPQSIIYTVIPLLCMILSIISIRTRKYKLGYVTSVVASVLKIRPLLHISFSGLSALAPTVFSLAIISFSAATFIICFFDSKQSYE